MLRVEAACCCDVLLVKLLDLLSTFADNPPPSHIPPHTHQIGGALIPNSSYRSDGPSPRQGGNWDERQFSHSSPGSSAASVQKMQPQRVEARQEEAANYDAVNYAPQQLASSMPMNSNFAPAPPPAPTPVPTPAPVPTLEQQRYQMSMSSQPPFPSPIPTHAPAPALAPTNPSGSARRATIIQQNYFQQLNQMNQEQEQHNALLKLQYIEQQQQQQQEEIRVRQDEEERRQVRMAGESPHQSDPHLLVILYTN